MKQGEDKVLRVLDTYDNLINGKLINKRDISQKFNVSEKSIQRDIFEINNYLLTKGHDYDEIIKYDRYKKGYILKNKKSNGLSRADLLVICKILLESRALPKVEINRIINLLISKNDYYKEINKLIQNQMFNYIEPRHGINIINIIWKITNSINEQKIVKVKYKRQDGKLREYLIKPLGLLFNEYYFYLIGEIKGKSNEIVFRIDRFIEYSVTNERFSVMYKDRFKEGEFLNKIQYMYTGELVKIQFKFRGRSLEAVLDRLPTANVITYDNEVPIIEAEVYWEGVKRWILSQQQYIEVIKPEEFRSEIKKL